VHAFEQRAKNRRRRNVSSTASRGRTQLQGKLGEAKRLDAGGRQRQANPSTPARRSPRCTWRKELTSAGKPSGTGWSAILLQPVEKGAFWGLTI
jgi:hypothetical protein